VIRPASESDAHGIAEVHVRSWQAAGIFSAEALGQLSVDERISTWLDAIASGEAVVVADEDGAVVGFAAVRAATEDQTKGLGELGALYVEPSSWGRGVGRDLVAADENALREGGFSDAILWVLDENRRARDFYAASGWREGAKRQTQFLGTDVRLVSYRKAL